MKGPAMLIVASSFGSAIFQRGTGDSVRFASVRSSTSLPNAAAAIASTTSGMIDPASMPLRTTISNSVTDMASLSVSGLTVASIGKVASTAMMASRCQPDSCRKVNMNTDSMLVLHQVAEDALERIVQRLDLPQTDGVRLREARQLHLQIDDL